MKMMALQNNRVVQTFDGAIPDTIARAYEWRVLPDDAPKPPDNQLYYGGRFYAPGTAPADLPAGLVTALSKGLPTITKFQFRHLFTLNERVAIDSVATNDKVLAADKAVIVTILADFASAEHVDLADPEVAQALDLFVANGLVARDRKARVLLNLPPA